MEPGTPGADEGENAPNAPSGGGDPLAISPGRFPTSPTSPGRRAGGGEALTISPDRFPATPESPDPEAGGGEPLCISPGRFPATPVSPDRGAGGGAVLCISPIRPFCKELAGAGAVPGVCPGGGGGGAMPTTSPRFTTWASSDGGGSPLVPGGGGGAGITPRVSASRSIVRWQPAWGQTVACSVVSRPQYGHRLTMYQRFGTEGIEEKHKTSHKAAGPPTKRCYRTQSRTRSRWSLIFIKNLTILEASDTMQCSPPLSFHCRKTDTRSQECPRRLHRDQGVGSACTTAPLVSSRAIASSRATTSVFSGPAARRAAIW